MRLDLSQVRRCHYITPNHTSSTPKRFIVFDTETMWAPCPGRPGVSRHTLRMGVAHYYVNSRGRWGRYDKIFFTDPVQFFAWVRSKISRRSPLWIVAHNLPFDWGIVHGWTMVKQLGWEEDWHCTRDPPNVFYFRTPQGNVRAIDTLNYVRASIKQIGEWVGLPKMPMPADNAGDSAWVPYCERDVEITWECMRRVLDWHSGNDLGTWRPTLAGVAWNAYRHRWMYRKILVHGSDDAIRLEGIAYRGGRSQAFYVGQYGGPVYHVDIRSAYPWAMSAYVMPLAIESVEVMPSISSVSERVNARCAIARVCIDSTTHDYPCVVDGERIYARGRFQTTLCTPELKRALYYGHVTAIGVVYWYKPADLFSQFCEWCYAGRQSAKDVGNMVIEAVYKSLPHGLYGRFGGRRTELIDEPGIDPPISDGQWMLINTSDHTAIEYVSSDCKTKRIARDTLTDDSCLAIPAHITSAMRVRMDRLREMAGARGVLLQYVDSLLLTQAGWERMLTGFPLIGDAMGDLRHVGTYDGVTIHSAGWWIADHARHTVGIPHSAKLVEDDEYEWLSFERAAGQLRRGPDGTIHVERVRRRAPAVNVHGRVVDGGWIEPVFLGAD